MPKSLLVIAYFAPPYGAVGAVRVTKIVKYLLKFGWDITIVSVEEKYYSDINEEWLQEIKGAKIIRTKISCYRIPGINEQGLYWFPFLKRKLKDLLKKESFDISFWSGGPFYHWPLAKHCYKRHGLKYVLDFRDPWSLHPYRSKSILSRLRDQLNKQLERKLLKYMSFAINVTEQGTNMYKETYPEYKEKFLTLPNGFDPEDFENINEKSYSNFDIVYTGKFGSFRDPAPFFKAFQSFVTKNNLSPTDIRFVWIGSSEKNIVDLLQKYVDSAYYTLTGFIPYSEAIQFVKGAGFCLLITGDHPYEPTTKIFDYLALAKPSLAISNIRGFVSQIISDVKNSKLKYNKEEEIIDALNFFYYRPKEVFKGDFSSSVIRKFNRRENTQKLNEWLVKVINE